MRFTKEMIAEDEKRWHARDVVTELGYCSTYMRDRKDMTNLDIRFYAYIMRKAREMLKRQIPTEAEGQEPGYVPIHPLLRKEGDPMGHPCVSGKCPGCGNQFMFIDKPFLEKHGNRLFCEHCGQCVTFNKTLESW